MSGDDLELSARRGRIDPLVSRNLHVVPRLVSVSIEMRSSQIRPQLPHLLELLQSRRDSGLMSS